MELLHALTLGCVCSLCTLFLLRFADDEMAKVEAVWALLLKNGVSRAQCRVRSGVGS
jgi:hypothetical protein